MMEGRQRARNVESKERWNAQSKKGKKTGSKEKMQKAWKERS